MSVFCLRGAFKPQPVPGNFLSSHRIYLDSLRYCVDAAQHPLRCHMLVYMHKSPSQQHGFFTGGPTCTFSSTAGPLWAARRCSIISTVWQSLGCGFCGPGTSPSCALEGKLCTGPQSLDPMHDPFCSGKSLRPLPELVRRGAGLVVWHPRQLEGDAHQPGQELAKLYYQDTLENSPAGCGSLASLNGRQPQGLLSR